MIRSYNQYVKKYNTYYFLKDYVVGITNNTGAEFLIDYDDYETVCQYTWNQNDKGYVYMNSNKKK